MSDINMQERTEETLKARLEQAKTIAQAQPGADVEVLGIWVWVQFASKPGDEVRDTLKENGFRWIRKRGRWAYAGMPSFGSKKSFEYLRLQYAGEV